MRSIVVICATSAFRKEGQERICVGLLLETFGLLLLSEGIFSLSLLGHLTATPTSVRCSASERHKLVKSFKKTHETPCTQIHIKWEVGVMEAKSLKTKWEVVVGGFRDINHS